MSYYSRVIKMPLISEKQLYLVELTNFLANDVLLQMTWNLRCVLSTEYQTRLWSFSEVFPDIESMEWEVWGPACQRVVLGRVQKNVNIHFACFNLATTKTSNGEHFRGWSDRSGIEDLTVEKWKEIYWCAQSWQSIFNKGAPNCSVWRSTALIF